MRAIMIMFDTLRRDLLPSYGGDVDLPNFRRLAEHTVTFDNAYVGSLPCMPARRELHTGRLNLLHRSWGPIEPFDDSMPEILDKAGIHTHITTDHFHYVQDGGATYMERYSSWECFRGQEDDKWKGCAKPFDPNETSAHAFGSILSPVLRVKRAKGGRQNDFNRAHRSGIQDYSQSLTFQAGLEFMEENKQYDNWFLTVESFDPHEPYDAPDSFRAQWQDPDAPFQPDWPPYGHVNEDPEFVENVRNQYKSSVQFCDYNLGRVLDFMDRENMWEDTMLIVNTDHGFLNGEHDWWGKGPMPDYQELVHVPFFLWDPRSGRKNVHCDSLVQTIDIAPTLLEFFNQPIPADMQGIPLRQAAAWDAPVHDTLLMGFFGGQLDITDGHYMLMYDIRQKDTLPREYTLMPTHMANRFTVSEMQTAKLTPGFRFTKGCPVLQITPERVVFVGDMSGDRLYDLKEDPKQLHPIENSAVYTRLVKALKEHFDALDAPEEQYIRYGLS